MFITYPVPLALFALLVAKHRARAAILLVVASLCRIYLQRVAARALGVRPAGPWLVLPRDFFGFAVWASGLVGTSVRWRDAELTIDTGDVLAPTELEAPAML
jgi:hypothetical protein